MNEYQLKTQQKILKLIEEGQKEFDKENNDKLVDEYIKEIDQAKELYNQSPTSPELYKKIVGLQKKINDCLAQLKNENQITEVQIISQGFPHVSAMGQIAPYNVFHNYLFSASVNKAEVLAVDLHS